MSEDSLILSFLILNSCFLKRLGRNIPDYYLSWTRIKCILFSMLTRLLFSLVPPLLWLVRGCRYWDSFFKKILNYTLFIYTLLYMSRVRECTHGWRDRTI